MKIQKLWADCRITPRRVKGGGLLSGSVHTVFHLYNNSATIHIHLYNNHIYSDHIRERDST